MTVLGSRLTIRANSVALKYGFIPYIWHTGNSDVNKENEEFVEYIDNTYLSGSFIAVIVALVHY